MERYGSGPYDELLTVSAEVAPGALVTETREYDANLLSWRLVGLRAMYAEDVVQGQGLSRGLLRN